MFALIQNGVCVSVNSAGFAKAVMGEDDYVTECEGYSVIGELHDREAGLFSNAEKSIAELAEEAQAYLDLTDYIENVYVREVIRNKSMTEDEYNLKYFDVIDLREDAIAVIGDYEDSL